MKVTVKAWEKGVLFRKGRMVRVLEPGRHRVWWFWRHERVEIIDMREGTLDLYGQEFPTRDGINIRVNVVASYRIVDPVAVLIKVKDVEARLYVDVQLAVRTRVGAMDLDGLMAARDALGTDLQDQVRIAAAEYGIEVGRVALKDVVLPGDIKRIMSRALEAKKEGQARLIARREEVAATRAAANTAAILERNPTLMRLKELETLQKLVESEGNTFVFGGEGGLKLI